MSTSILQPYVFIATADHFSSCDVRDVLNDAHQHYEAQVRQLGGMAQPDAPMPREGCAECGKTSTPDSMWALYCVACIESKIAPALAAPAQPDGDAGCPVVEVCWHWYSDHDGGWEVPWSMPGGAQERQSRRIVLEADHLAAMAAERQHAQALRETFLRMQREHSAAMAAKDDEIDAIIGSIAKQGAITTEFREAERERADKLLATKDARIAELGIELTQERFLHMGQAALESTIDVQRMRITALEESLSGAEKRAAEAEHDLIVRKNADRSTGAVFHAHMQAHVDMVTSLQADQTEERNRIASMRAELGAEVTTLVAKLAAAEARALAAEADASKWRRLGTVKCNSMTLSYNDGHATNYMTASDWIDTHPDWYEDTDPAEVQRMRDTNTIWSLQIYPDTPVGFNDWKASNLDAVFAAAMAKQLEQKT